MRFFAAGGIAAIVNFCSRIMLSEVMPYTPAIVVAYCIGMATAFSLNRMLVFPGAVNRLHSQMGWFVAVNLIAVAQTILLSLLFARVVFSFFSMGFHPETMAHAIGVIVPVFTSYYGHKHLSFRSIGPGKYSEQKPRDHGEQ
jgi:putative flippase GtrA